MKLKNQNILIVSPEPWTKSFVSKHHYAKELSRNNNVYFLNPPNIYSKEHPSVTRISSSLVVINYHVSIKGINSIPILIRRWLTLLDAKKIVGLCEGKIDIVWSFDPFRFQDPSVFKAKKSIYHAADLHNTTLESEIVQNSDLVLGVSNSLLDRLGNKKHKYFINHGLAEHFTKFKFHLPNYPKEILKVGFVGNLNKRDINVASFKKAIIDHPNTNFYFIGPRVDLSLRGKVPPHHQFWKELEAFNNVHFVAEVSTNKLPEYIDEMDVLMLNSVVEQNSIAVSNSHKVLEYLVSGKVVVSHMLDQYKEARELLIMPNESDDFNACLKKVLDNIETYNNKDNFEVRRNYALKNTYQNQIGEIQKILDHTAFDR